MGFINNIFLILISVLIIGIGALWLIAILTPYSIRTEIHLFFVGFLTVLIIALIFIIHKIKKRTVANNS